MHEPSISISGPPGDGRCEQRVGFATPPEFESLWGCKYGAVCVSPYCESVVVFALFTSRM